MAIGKDRNESLDILNSLGLPRDWRSRAISPSFQIPTPLNHLTQPILCASVTVCTHTSTLKLVIHILIKQLINFSKCPNWEFKELNKEKTRIYNRVQTLWPPRMRLRFEGCDFNDTWTGCEMTLKNWQNRGVWLNKLLRSLDVWTAFCARAC